MRTSILVVSLLSLAATTASARQQQEAINLRYIGSQHISVTVADDRNQRLVSRQLVSNQTIHLPLETAKGKKYKKFVVRVGERELELSTGCKPKLLRKNLTPNIFELSYTQGLKRPPCFTKDSGGGDDSQ